MEFVFRAGVVTVVFQLSLYFYDLYDLNQPRTGRETVIRMMQSFGVGCIILAFLYMLFPAIIVPTDIFWGSYIIICLSLFLWRSLYYLILEKKLFTRDFIIVGTGETAEKIVEITKTYPESGFAVRGLVGRTAPVFDHEGIPVYADLNEVAREAHLAGIDRIVIALDDRRGAMPIGELLRNKLEGRVIEDLSSTHK
ncbi:nucleoside-diphosphate sugar epimerase/dehydratase [Desulfobulbus alkaliphilus]|uniref:nucleoside-diphosphate sugar epimerase/dehydratase n=1 Tax=Desulfobulbus alkaliphilus TaxID=869814 RepID=UPI00196407ED|nr:hypothetical protein [Desulfobulbus alkaliphilus]MBM9538870.1 hypothetical protein [Desulfobulbus alkaliphilus]